MEEELDHMYSLLGVTTYFDAMVLSSVDNTEVALSFVTKYPKRPWQSIQIQSLVDCSISSRQYSTLLSLSGKKRRWAPVRVHYG